MFYVPSNGGPKSIKNNCIAVGTRGCSSRRGFCRNDFRPEPIFLLLIIMYIIYYIVLGALNFRNGKYSRVRCCKLPYCSRTSNDLYILILYSDFDFHQS